jgi:hypothetical protein
LGACAPRVGASAPAPEAIDEARARGIARGVVGDPCRRGEVAAQRREHGGRPMWRVACALPLSRESAELHVVWIDAVTSRVETTRSELVARGQAPADAAIGQGEAIELARAKLGIRCLRSTFTADATQREGRPWWDVKCTAAGDEAEHVSSALVDATTGEVEIDQFELDVHGPRTPRSSIRAVEPAEAVSESGALEIARKLLGPDAARCRAEHQSFDSGARWAVRCEVPVPGASPLPRTVWIDAATGAAEIAE